MKTGNYDENRLLHLLLDMGEMLLDSGAEIKRVEDTLQRIGCAYGAARMNVFVITSSIVITMEKMNGELLTHTKRVNYTGSTDFTALGTAECPQQELLHESDSDGSVSEKTS